MTSGLVAVVPATFPGTRGARGLRLVSHDGMRDERGGFLKRTTRPKETGVARDPSRDAKSGTVV